MNQLPPLPENRWCSQCGASIQPNANFCHACGAPVQKSAVTPSQSVGREPPPPRQTKSARFATGYVGKHLMPGENIIYRTQLHWAVFFKPLVLFIVAIWLLSVGNARKFGELLLLLVVFPMTVDALVARATSEFAVTNKRVLIKTGWIRRHSLETLLNKVEGISVDQGILGRMWHYGTIVVSGTGGSKEPFHRIAAPMQFRRKVQEQIAASEVGRNTRNV